MESMRDYVEQIKAETFSLINQVRLNVGLQKVTHSPVLEQMGQIHTNEMYTRHFFGHENTFCPSVKSIADRMQYCNAVATFDMVGEVLANRVCVDKMENIGVKYTEEEKLLPLPSVETLCVLMVKDWLLSEGHKNIILCPDYTYMGLGLLLYPKKISNVKFKCLLVTQNLGRRRNS